MADKSLQKLHERVSLARVIAALADGRRLDGAEREASDECVARSGMELQTTNSARVPFGALRRVRRDLTVGSATGGGFLVSSDLADAEALLPSYSALAAAGPTMHVDAVGNVLVPRITSAPAPQWLAVENSQLSEVNHTLGQLALAPKTVGSTINISRQLSLQSDADAILANALMAHVGAAADAALLATGDGTGGAPVSLTRQGITPIDGASLALADVTTALANFGDAVSPGSRLAAITTPTVAATLRGRAEMTNSSVPLWTGLPHRGALAGVPGFGTTAMTAGGLVLGAFEHFHMVIWGGGLELALDPYSGTNFRTGVVSVRVLLTIDGGPSRPLAFAYAPTVT